MARNAGKCPDLLKIKGIYGWGGLGPPTIVKHAKRYPINATPQKNLRHCFTHPKIPQKIIKHVAASKTVSISVI
jgi:hypothetical protein